ncbi:hypothetical protein JGS39_04800 [Streptomyces sp. P01-B04]|uniref:hypothetical protein n=1 Tax=Streptomyces TaxID=1883 RepID=UPI001C5E23D2|nr:hypothetical protein [Streptomyces poriferorum]MBW5248349.1 hypothetical protein [Streptomyces poriferorum]MBW5255631.1 hypothetical protein [Streptomyces poriferorum]
MSRTYRLQDEDRPDYALVLDDAIRAAEIRGLLEHSLINPGQLRVRGLGARPRIAAAADAEYRTYLSLRQRTRDAAPADQVGPLSGAGDQEVHGVGLLPALAVLTPVLAAVATVAFLPIGYGLALAGGRTPMANALITAGWTSFGIGVLSAAVGLFSLYRTAVEHRASAAGRGSGPSPEVNRAREAWLTSLRDKAILPFLRNQLHSPDAPATGISRGSDSGRGTADFPSPGFGSPDYSGPGLGSAHAPFEGR